MDTGPVNDGLCLPIKGPASVLITSLTDCLRGYWILLRCDQSILTTPETGLAYSKNELTQNTEQLPSCALQASPVGHLRCSSADSRGPFHRDCHGLLVVQQEDLTSFCAAGSSWTRRTSSATRQPRQLALAWPCRGSGAGASPERLSSTRSACFTFPALIHPHDQSKDLSWWQLP